MVTSLKEGNYITIESKQPTRRDANLGWPAPEILKEIRCKDDMLTNLYTLIIKSDTTYEDLIDRQEVEIGELEYD